MGPHFLKLLLATENLHKVAEFREAMGTHVEVLSLQDIKISNPLPEETGTTYEENALLKARFVAQQTQMLSLADDSGFEVEAMNNEPGVYTARFMGTNEISIQRAEILRRLEKETNRRARFVSVLSLCDPKLGLEKFFRGIVEGHVPMRLRGDKGFGYDPLFIPDGDTRTFAEMSMAEKRALSHRGKAVAQLLQYLSTMKT